MTYSSWPSSQVLASRNALVGLRSLLDELHQDTKEVEAALSRFLVVRSCGHVELCLEQGLLDALADTCPEHIHAYIESGFFRGKNPAPSRLVSLLGSFRPCWGAEMEATLKEDDEYLERELSFLVNRRNKIAHGQSEGIGRAKALSLCDAAIRISERLLDIIKPASFGSA